MTHARSGEADRVLRPGHLALGCIALIGCTWFEACAGAPVTQTEPIVGTFTIFNRSSPYLIAAPHGEFDEKTGEIVWKFCRVVRWDCLIVEGFREESAAINVNRPSEGVRISDTQFTERAALVYARYVEKIRKLTPALRLYVEIHGNDRSESKKHIEIATVGITPAQAERIAALFRKKLKAVGLDLEIRIDVLDQIHYNATHARRFGVLSFLNPALHIELPVSARTDSFQKTVRFLAKTLPVLVKREFPK